MRVGHVDYGGGFGFGVAQGDWLRACGTRQWGRSEGETVRIWGGVYTSGQVPGFEG